MGTIYSFFVDNKKETEEEIEEKEDENDENEFKRVNNEGMFYCYKIDIRNGKSRKSHYICGEKNYKVFIYFNIK
jgi:hypothetical protein